MIVKVDAKETASPFWGCDFEVSHVPALAPYAPMPGGAAMFRNFFA